MEGGTVILIYLTATVAVSMISLALASLIPLRFRIGPSKLARLLTSLSFIWHLLLMVVSVYVVNETATGVDTELLPFVLLAFVPGAAVATVRIVLAVRDIRQLFGNPTE
jgi:hypothetical protein